MTLTPSGGPAEYPEALPVGRQSGAWCNRSSVIDFQPSVLPVVAKNAARNKGHRYEQGRY